MVKIRIALKKTWRVPSLSASHPENGMTVAMVSEYAITTPCMRRGASPRLFAMAGKAVLTMVESRVCMKKPVATSHNMMVSDWGEGVGVTFERIVSGMKGAGRECGDFTWMCARIAYLCAAQSARGLDGTGNCSMCWRSISSRVNPRTSGERSGIEKEHGHESC